MPRRPQTYAEAKPQRHVRRDTGQAKTPDDPVKQAFEACWAQGKFGVGVSARARAELFFRAGAAFGNQKANAS